MQDLVSATTIMSCHRHITLAVVILDASHLRLCRLHQNMKALFTALLLVAACLLLSSRSYDSSGSSSSAGSRAGSMKAVLSCRPTAPSVILLAEAAAAAAEKIGVCWGRNSWQQLPPPVVVQLLKDNGITRLKLFSADEDILKALVGTDIEVKVMVTNNYLSTMAASPGEAKNWVSSNVAPYVFPGGVKITHIQVSNEPFLTSLKGQYNNLVVPAMRNIWQGLKDLKMDDKVKLTVPLNADVLEESYPPSSGKFRSELTEQITQIAEIVRQTKSEFSINIYPFLTLFYATSGDSIPLTSAFVGNDSNSKVIFTDPVSKLKYYNIFDGAYDAVIQALNLIDYSDLDVIIGEIGWPTDGQGDTRGYATLDNARQFTNAIISHLLGGRGTPALPGKVIHAYLYALTDEDRKSVLPGDFERSWGLYRSDGVPKFEVDLAGTGSPAPLAPVKNLKLLPARWCVAKQSASDSALAISLSYACSPKNPVDCTPTLVGGSCYFGGNIHKVASYVFNSYFQLHGQEEAACTFEGNAEVTTTNPSTGNCTFLLGIDVGTSKSAFKSNTIVLGIFMVVIASIMLM